MSAMTTLLTPSPTAQKIWVLLNGVVLGALFYNRLPFLWQLTLAGLWFGYSFSLYYKEIALQHPKSLLALELNHNGLTLYLKSGHRETVMLGEKTFLSRFYVILQIHPYLSLPLQRGEGDITKRMIWADSMSPETWRLWQFGFKKTLSRL